jgi:hypothetical protein
MSCNVIDQSSLNLSKCYGCSINLNSYDPAAIYQTLKIIQKTVRVPSSLYTMNLGALNVYQHPIRYRVNWNQMSDRAIRHTQPAVVSSHGSSTHGTITRNRPNAGTPGGAGCDIKHNSYYRYMNRLKGKSPLRRGVVPPDFGTPIKFNPAYPIYGGKTMKTSIINNCNCPSGPAGNKNNQELYNIYSQPISFAPDYSIQLGDYVYTREDCETTAGTTCNSSLIGGTVIAENNGVYTRRKV